MEGLTVDPLKQHVVFRSVYVSIFGVFRFQLVSYLMVGRRLQQTIFIYFRLIFGLDGLCALSLCFLLVH